MRLVAIPCILIPFTIAYPLGRPLRILHFDEIAHNDTRTRLRSPFPVLLVDSIEKASPSSLGDFTPVSVTQDDFTRSFVTTLLGGVLALYFT